MPSRKFVVDPGHWCFRAEEARTVADQMTHEEARTIMRRIAMDYDRLAKLAEVQLIQEAIGEPMSIEAAQTDTDCPSAHLYTPACSG